MLTLDLYWETKLHTAKWFLKSLSHAATSHHHWQGQSRPLKLCVHLSEHTRPHPHPRPQTQVQAPPQSPVQRIVEASEAPATHVCLTDSWRPEPGARVVPSP